MSTIAVSRTVTILAIFSITGPLCGAEKLAAKQGPPPTYANEAYGPSKEIKPANPGDNQLFDVWIPSGNGPYPCYVFFHGGGFTKGSKDGGTPRVAAADLNAQGVVFFDANYRLGNPRIAYKDAAAMLAYIKENATRYKINPEKIVVGGGSAGCMIALNLTYDQKIKGICGVWTQQVPKPVSLGGNAAKLAAVKVPVFVIHRDPYPTDNLHSTLKGFQYAEGAWRSGVDAIFIAGATDLNIAMICNPTDPDKYAQCWRNGVWLKDKTVKQAYELPSLGQWIKKIRKLRTDLWGPTGTMKIATWNVNSVRARLDRLLAWLQRTQPDILCLQELKAREDVFPYDAIRAAGYHAAVYGQRTFNGVGILSRIEPQNIHRGMGDGVEDPQARFSETAPV